MRKIVLCFFLFVILIQFCSCGLNDLSDQEVLKELIETSIEYSDSSNLRSRTRKYISRLKLDGDCVLEKEELALYFENESPEKFFKGFGALCSSGLLKEEAVDRILDDCYQLDQLVTMESFKNGYYIINPSAQPQSGTKSKTGKFNNAADGNSIYSSSRDDVYKARYYGDFAIEHIDGYHYNEGIYKWVGGKFYDVPARWDSYSEDNIYFKGSKLESKYLKYDTFNVENPDPYLNADLEELKSLNFHDVFGFYAFDDAKEKLLYIFVGNDAEVIRYS